MEESGDYVPLEHILRTMTVSYAGLSRLSVELWAVSERDRRMNDITLRVSRSNLWNL